MYSVLKESLNDIINGEPNFIANAAQFSALLFSGMKEINWVGFYMMNGKELVLGPFNGKPACVRIPFGKGVCGSAARNRNIILVDDVHKFPGHIACDPSSNSEIVIPLIKDKVLYGVLDIDSPYRNRFGSKDKEALSEITDMLLDQSDMEALKKYYNI